MHPTTLCCWQRVHKRFSKDLKPFFYFANGIRVNDLKARSDTENDLMPFEDITYPMDMSAEQKCFNLGGGVK